MLRNYWTIAWRNISRHKLYTAINVLGLSLGVCACIVIYLITSYDLDFDTFHPGKERIYRIVGEFQRSSGERSFMNSPNEDVAGFQKQIPGFEATAGIHFYRAAVSIADGNKPVKKFDSRVEGGYSTSTIITWPEYFSIFTYEWLAGSPATSMNGPFKVVLTEKRARKYFGNIALSEMIGKTVTYDDSLQVNVSGIVKDWDKKTDFGYTDFISIETARSNFLKKQHITDDWTSLNPHRSMAFVKLDRNATASEINGKLAAYIKTHIKFDNGSKLTMWLQPLNDIHFTKEFHRGDDGDSFRKAYMPILYVLMGVAGFILLLASINFINLSTAQSLQRAKEIGVRKVLGSSKTKIIYQFLSETLIITVFSVIISVLLVQPALTAFSGYIPEGVSFNLLEPSTLLFIISVTLITSLLAGFYPAKVLAAYLPVLSLKGAGVQKASDKINLRKALIVFQFTTSLIFIIGVLVIGKQIRYMSNANKGFNTDAVITVYNWNDHEGKLKVFAESIRGLPGVEKAILQGTAPMGFAQNIDNFKYKKRDDISRQVLADIGDNDFIPFYGMKILAGNNMPAGDSLTGLVINEAFSKSLGFTDPQQAIGEFLYQQGYAEEKPYPIVGVVADYHTGSFHEAIQPVVIENVTDRKSGVAIKIATTNKNTLARLEAEWKKIFPTEAFNYSFLNDSISALFDQERKTIWLMNAAMGITIFISCMGLFGLSMFTAERRRKEIGIRKVLGATAINIVRMLSKDFIKLVIIAVLIASPVAWYFMNQWLQDFAYRTQISWWLFAIAAMFAIIISLITISYLAIKAAISNPVKSLRME